MSGDELETSSLLVELTYGLGVAVIGAALAVRLGQSTILGFIAAGVIIGPSTPGPVGDIEAVNALADIGIVLLLFALGLQLSFGSLLQAGWIASIGGSAQILLTIGIGYLAGIAVGWQPLESIFFGAVLSNSSSTVISKILGERGELGAEHGHIALAWSTVQDLSTVVMVVVLTAVAGDGGFVVTDVVWSMVKALGFLAVLIVAGSKILPRVFSWVAALRNREVFVLTIAALAITIAYVSSLFGLSIALGAFIAGLIISESDLSYQVLGEVIPVRDIFSGLFFVSIGLLVDPGFLLGNVPLVLMILGLIVVGKGLLVAGIAALFKYPTRTAMLIGISMAQSAEFSFILASLGLGLGVISNEVFNLILAGTAASIVLSPFLHSGAGPAAQWVERWFPQTQLATHPALVEEAGTQFRGHAIICGYGRVGRIIGMALQRRGFSYVVIEQDQNLVNSLRKQGTVALLGSGSNTVLLEHARLRQARALIVAIPDVFAARQIVSHARAIGLDLDIVVRTHNEAERQELERLGADEAVVGELELALEMTRHTLRRFGVSSLETLAIIQGLRTGPERGTRVSE